MCITFTVRQTRKKETKWIDTRVHINFDVVQIDGTEKRDSWLWLTMSQTIIFTKHTIHLAAHHSYTTTRTLRLLCDNIYFIQINIYLFGSFCSAFALPNSFLSFTLKVMLYMNSFANKMSNEQTRHVDSEVWVFVGKHIFGGWLRDTHTHTHWLIVKPLEPLEPLDQSLSQTSQTNIISLLKLKNIAKALHALVSTSPSTSPIRSQKCRVGTWNMKNLSFSINDWCYMTILLAYLKNAHALTETTCIYVSTYAYS